MKLLYTPNSPYSRVARICALQQQSKLEFEAVGVREKAGRILDHNPAAIVPTLVLDDGNFLTETRLICEYLEDSGPGGFVANRGDLEGRHREGFVNNLLDGVAVWIREIRRPADEQSPAIIALEKARFERCSAYLEHHWDSGDLELSYASAMLASAIELIDTRVSVNWRDSCPGLADWYARISANELLKRTAPLPP